MFPTPHLKAWIHSTVQLSELASPIQSLAPKPRPYEALMVVWQSSWPASFLPAGLTLCWISKSAGSWLWAYYQIQVRIPVGWCGDITLGARLQAWVKLSALIVHSEPTDCHVSLWPGENGGLPDRGVWCHWGREECDNPAGLLASRERVWPFGRVGWSTGSRLWVSYQSRFEYQWGCWCRDITLMWQSSRPASFSPVGLTLWSNSLSQPSLPLLRLTVCCTEQNATINLYLAKWWFTADCWFKPYQSISSDSFHIY